LAANLTLDYHAALRRRRPYAVAMDRPPWLARLTALSRAAPHPEL